MCGVRIVYRGLRFGGLVYIDYEKLRNLKNSIGSFSSLHILVFDKGCCKGLGEGFE